MLCIGLEERKSVTAKDMTQLNVVEKKLLPLEGTLAAFEQVTQGLERASQRFLVLVPNIDPGIEQDLAKVMYNYRHRVTAYRNHLRVVLLKCSNASKLLNGILNLNDQYIAREHSSHVLHLTRSMGVITAITLTFLSFTAVAVSLDWTIFDAKILICTQGYDGDADLLPR